MERNITNYVGCFDEAWRTLDSKQFYSMVKNGMRICRDLCVDHLYFGMEYS